ncbi:serine hydrolase domain-containing protein [Virgibacillus sp. YIM 98842]|uniref:serine hydrolase domain-containing protein n=1 Tax=Virgibacillus sp. YIM 98842 TaxID=2663533 RepID=UPI0013DC9E05|nr:serine hydrolase domain-containing protein [Virgibacillus sp. YIM 98842]
MLKRMAPVMIFLFAIILFTGTASILGASNGLFQDNPSEADMLQLPLDDMDPLLEEAMEDHVMPGAVVLIAKDGKVVKHDAYGYAARYTDSDFTEMDDPVEMSEDTIFDLASISKLFTATAVMQLWDQGAFELDDPVADYIPEFAANGKEEVTIRQLLTHTSGFRPSTTAPLHEIEGDREDKLAFVLNESLQNPPGQEYLYSDVDFITLGVLIERLSGMQQDEFTEQFITGPLNMTDTMYNPPAKLKHRIAATEEQPWVDRELVWGEVHDEKAWTLDGVAGHAGVFSTAADLAVFGQMMLQQGTYNGVEVLSEEAVELISTNWNEDIPGARSSGLGWELNQSWYMDRLAESNTLGHTGYTGTSIVVSPNNNTIALLLTNRVHPTRETVSTNPVRQLVAEKTGAAISAWSAASMKDYVEVLEARDAFAHESAAHALKLHLTAVHQYELQHDAEKVNRHMESLQALLEYQLDQELITEAAYDDLMMDAAYLIDSWQ